VDHAKAEELLSGLDLAKGPDGFWATPDGKTLEFEITSRPDYTDWVVAAEEIARQLTEFGIKTGVRLIEPAIFGPTLAGRDFDMVIEFGVFAKFHPVQGYKRLYDPTDWIAQISGFDPKVVGPEGEIIDLNELQDKLWTIIDPDEQKAIVELLAWATNEYLPMVEFLEKNAQFFVCDGVRVTGWPYGPELENKFGFNWRLGSLKWMIEGVLVPVE
jgi:peptide/nickel transport system substrate-binding protein